MYECVANDRRYLLADSIRDDGLLPYTVINAVETKTRSATRPTRPT